MPLLLNAIYLFGLLIGLPWLVYKALTTGKYRRGLLRKLTGRALLRIGDAPCVWFHGVSVGESSLRPGVGSGLRAHHRDCDWAMTGTTAKGYEEACKRFPD